MCNPVSIIMVRNVSLRSQNNLTMFEYTLCWSFGATILDIIYKKQCYSIGINIIYPLFPRSLWPQSYVV